MYTCGVERLLNENKGLMLHRGGAAEEFGEASSCRRVRREATTPSEVTTRDTGRARDRASGTGVTAAIIPIDPTRNFHARAPVLDHLTMPDGDTSASEEVNLGARR